MKDYGGLKPGMNADIAIYNINPDKFPSSGPEIEKAFANVAYLFKDGKICVEGGKVVDMGKKQTFWVDAKVMRTSRSRMISGRNSSATTV